MFESRHSILPVLIVFACCWLAVILGGCGGGGDLTTLTTTLATPTASFKVAAVKPHYGCTELDGQDRVRQYIGDLVVKGFGLVALNQMQFQLNLDASEPPSGYNAFGGVCFEGWADNVAVLFDESQFQISAMLGTSIEWKKQPLPFLSDGQSPQSGSMCIDADVQKSGERAYTGAVLLHTESGKEVCVIAGTFTHCDQTWSESFLESLSAGCGFRQLLIIADTNAGCPFGDAGIPPQGANGTLVSMQDIGTRHHVDWGACSDPGPTVGETCCNDIAQGHPEPRFWFDRTALCRGGTVKNFEVAASYVCRANEEHRFTTSIVDLMGSEVV